jgi:hypothetical protein
MLAFAAAGFVLGKAGIHYIDWQFWAIIAILVFVQICNRLAK